MAMNNQPNYIFDENIYNVVKDYFYTNGTPKWFHKRSGFTNDSTSLSFEDYNMPITAYINIQQTGTKTGKLILKLSDEHLATDPTYKEIYSEFKLFAQGLIPILGKHIINLKRKRNQNEQSGQELAIIYEKMTSQSAKPGTGPVELIKNLAGIKSPRGYTRTKKTNMPLKSAINKNHENFRKSRRRTRRV
jgi:hypothetical protein